jgi:hypothetical protein
MGAGGMPGIAVASLMVVLFAPPLAAAPTRSSLPSACKPRFEAAREELLRRGFAPTRDQDTGRWLRVEESPSSVMLALEMRPSADGPATGYRLWVQHPRRGLQRTPWHHRLRRPCCGEHAAKEDRLVELVWGRANGLLEATISIIEFDSGREDAPAKTWRDLFTEVARAAADDCLSAKSRTTRNSAP